MKKLYLPLLILLSSIVTVPLRAESVVSNCCRVECSTDDSCDCEITSRSYMAARTRFNSASPELVSAFRTDRVDLGNNDSAMQAVVFGGKTTNDRDLARYFFPSCKTVLTVDEGIFDGFNADAPILPQDLLAQHFGIRTTNGNFRSEISIRPEQSVVGLGLHSRKSFCRDEEKGRGWWTSASFSVQRVENDLKFVEKVIRDGGGAALTTADSCELVQANMTEAFQQASWNFGKIADCTLKKTGVADIELKVGYEWLDQDPCHLESYLGILIPTGNKPKGEYLFEPIVGNGHHWGIMTGSAFGAHIWGDEEKNRSLRIEYNMHTQYLFRNTQCRAVDLVCKPWSRYIEMYANVEQAELAFQIDNNADNYSDETKRDNLSNNLRTPGINVLTLPLKVRPGFSNNMTAAVVGVANQFQGELGYNLYCRQSECIKLACPWVEGPAIKHTAGDGITNPVRDITGNFRKELNSAGFFTGDSIDDTLDLYLNLRDYQFNIIKEKDLDLKSASTPCTITQTVYGSLGMNYTEREYPFFVNFGGSYEFSNAHNGVMERWTAWGKLGVSY